MHYRIAEHRIVRTGEDGYLFLVGEKAVFEMDPLTEGFIAGRSSREGFSIEDALPELAGLEAADRLDFLQGLLRRRVLVPASPPKALPTETPAPGGDIPLQTLILHVTDACNLDCGYCYERSGRPGGGGRPMTPETARRAVDFLMERSGGLQDLVMVFFGGEPLLNFPVVEAAAAHARQAAARAGKRVDFALTTNGTVLTEPILAFLRENRVAVTVSLDGCPDAHDRFRRFADGRPSHAAIVERIQGLVGPAAARPAVARATLTRGFADVPAALDHLLGLGFVEAGFAPVTTGAAEHQLTSEDMDRLLEQFGLLAERFLEAALSDRFLGFSNLVDLLVALHQGRVMDYPCGAGLGLFSVATDGSLFLCQRFTGLDAYRMGSISEGLDAERVAGFRKAARVVNKAECRGCWARTVCTGGCYHEACVREGGHLQPNRHYCDWIRRWTALGLEVYCRLASRRPDVLERLSASRGYAN